MLKVQNPQEAGLSWQMRQAAAQEPLPPQEEGEKTPQPRGQIPGLENAAPQSAIIRRPSPNLATPANPGQHKDLPRPQNCSKTRPSTSTSKLGTSLSFPASHKVARRPDPECPAAAQGPPHPRSLRGVVWGTGGCGACRGRCRSPAEWCPRAGFTSGQAPSSPLTMLVI